MAKQQDKGPRSPISSNQDCLFGLLHKQDIKLYLVFKAYLWSLYFNSPTNTLSQQLFHHVFSTLILFSSLLLPWGLHTCSSLPLEYFSPGLSMANSCYLLFHLKYPSLSYPLYNYVFYSSWDSSASEIFSSIFYCHSPLKYNLHQIENLFCRISCWISSTKKVLVYGRCSISISCVNK